MNEDSFSKRMKTTTSWGKVAEWYDTLLDNTDTYQAKVILPNLLRVLALKRGERVLDIACGQGFFSRTCRDMGAQVTGADISKELIGIARTQSPVDIEYHVAPSHSLSFARDENYDTALVILAIQNIEKMSETFAEANRVLAPNGRLVLVLNHPTFRVLRHSSWGYDEKTGLQYRRIDRYLSGEKVKIDMHPGEEGGEQTISYHRSLQDISKALKKNGFAIARLEEWISHRSSEKGPRQEAENTARKEIPLFMLLETIKIGNSRQESDK